MKVQNESERLSSLKELCKFFYLKIINFASEINLFILSYFCHLMARNWKCLKLFFFKLSAGDFNWCQLFLNGLVSDWLLVSDQTCVGIELAHYF